MKSKNIFLILSVFILVLSSLFASCASEDAYELVPESLSCKLNLAANVVGYSRSARATQDTQWADSSVIYIKFKDENQNDILGHALYKESAKTWIVYYKSALPKTNAGKCMLYYFDNIGKKVYTNYEFLLTDSTAIYVDSIADYTFNGAELSIKSTLKPVLGRIRFEGSKGDKIAVNGIKTCSAFYLQSGVLAYDTNSYLSKVRYVTDSESGKYYTPYIYGFYSDDADRQIGIVCKDGVFKRSNTESTLASGRSGYISLPYESNYNGWTRSWEIIHTETIPTYNFYVKITGTEDETSYKFYAFKGSELTWKLRVYDYATSNNTMYMYLDDQLIGSDVNDATRSFKITEDGLHEIKIKAQCKSAMYTFRGYVSATVTNGIYNEFK